MHGVWSTYSSSCALASAVIILLRFLVVPVTFGLGFGNNLLAFVDIFASSFCRFLALASDACCSTVFTVSNFLVFISMEPKRKSWNFTKPEIDVLVAAVDAT